MDVNGGHGRRRMNRGETSPDQARAMKDGRRNAVAARKRLQIVYYLCRNGHLEHPHFMEISHLRNQHPRLKDVLDRLTILRGRGMPSLFSWSCKRSYKNGYVWNDLSENDVIYPAEGAEYILKGSEIIHGRDPTSSEKLQHLQLSRRSRFPAGGEAIETGEEEEEEEEEEDEEGKHNGRNSIQPYNRCSRGVITDAKLVKELSRRTTHATPRSPSMAPPSVFFLVRQRPGRLNHHLVPVRGR
ncbi:hypothetical protein HPP92_027134 [Vanilla planifolia]|uniref:SOSEKI DIX-like domain-containing protein n=1 Tax=Vanilla planifolia TaxID=51239 RepID=A0A835PDJ4_VANPL|nr:hypothetical protein HPP92_027134 [Vanilla planifolia]